MPRPATKRNRPTKAPLPSSKPTITQTNNEDNLQSANAPKSVSNENQTVTSTSQTVDDAQNSSISQQQVKNQTPISKTHEQAIESSPMGERAPTSSRPPTRARGYSSTLSLAGRKGDNSSKIPGTPGFESSVLSNFRRRARQPSILQMMQAEDRSSDLDDDDFLGGLSPDDESTPLNVSRGKSLILRHAASSSPKSSSRESSRKRKWTDEELQVPQSPLGVVESTPIGSPVPEAQETESRTCTNVSRPVESPEVSNQTMAPPMSSSAPQSPVHTSLMPTIDRASPATSGRTKAPSEVFPGDLGHLSTTSLQNKLLPRRRKPRRNPRGAVNYDFESDDSEADERDDELNYFPGRKPVKSQRTQTNKSKPLAKTHAKPDKNKNSVSRSNEGVMSAGKENQPTDMSSPLSSALDSDEFDSDTGADISDELRIQAKKFAEVDKWQMDFEDVISTTGSQGSSFR